VGEISGIKLTPERGSERGGPPGSIRGSESGIWGRESIWSGNALVNQVDGSSDGGSAVRDGCGGNHILDNRADGGVGVSFNGAVSEVSA